MITYKTRLSYQPMSAVQNDSFDKKLKLNTNKLLLRNFPTYPHNKLSQERQKNSCRYQAEYWDIDREGTVDFVINLYRCTFFYLSFTIPQFVQIFFGGLFRVSCISRLFNQRIQRSVSLKRPPMIGEFGQAKVFESAECLLYVDLNPQMPYSFYVEIQEFLRKTSVVMRLQGILGKLYSSLPYFISPCLYGCVT